MNRLCALTLVLVAGCGGGTSDPMADVAALCDARTAGATSGRLCSSACSDAWSAADDTCLAEADALETHAENGAYSSCLGGCATGASCDTGGGTIGVPDCACRLDCLAERSADFQRVAAASARCYRTAMASACF